MGTVSSSPGSGSSSDSNPITFSGTSTYASDFQTVLNRAVEQASQPMIAMQTDVTDLTAQQSALSGLETNFSALQTALQAIGTAASGGASAQSSDPSSVTATASSSALNGTYTVQVDGVGSSTTTLSDVGTTVTDPTTGNISSSTSFTLTLNDVSTTITPSGTSLESLAQAINSASAGVQATIVNVGSNSSPDYRLALTSDELGPDTIQLNDGDNNPLLETLSTGADAEYQVDPVTGGTPTDIQSTSSQVTLSPGLTVNLLQQTSSPVTITVATNYTALQSALSNFATAYNTALSSLAQEQGQNGGPLTGQSIVYSLANVLNGISTYSSDSGDTGGAGSVGSLSDLGITLELGGTGTLSFDPATFAAANPASVQQFLGSISSSGFLQSANSSLDAMTDPTTGVLQSDTTAIQTQITNENADIAEQQTIITDLQTNLQSQLSSADAAIATLQAQNTYYTQLFNAEYGNNSINSNG